MGQGRSGASKKLNLGLILPVVIVIGLITTLIGAALILLGLSSLHGSAVNLQKYQSLSLNNACAEEALLLIEQNPSYTCSDCTVTVGSQVCNYKVVNTGGTNRRLETWTTISDNVVGRTLIQLTVNDSGNITIISWEEVADF